MNLLRADKFQPAKLVILHGVGAEGGFGVFFDGEGERSWKRNMTKKSQKRRIDPDFSIPIFPIDPDFSDFSAYGKMLKVMK